MRVGLIGLGYVGKSTLELFRDHAEVVTYDIADGPNYPEEQLSECDFAVVCVDTPQGPSGACDTDNVFEAIKRLPTARVLLRSTVPPGTTDRLSEATGKQICFSPEYIGQSTYHQPFFPHDVSAVPFTVLGGTAQIRHYFIDALLPILGPSKVYFQCESREAELIKYMENSYFATKVTFVNEFYEICRVFEADWNTVREGWLLDPRVESMHTAVFRNERGFGGKCLPKDTNAIVRAATDAGYEPHLLAEVLSSNSRFRRES